VGHSAAGRALDEHAITLAVMASVRHEDTDYDSLLMSGVPRDIARDQTRAAVDRILAARSWHTVKQLVRRFTRRLRGNAARPGSVPTL
jgi:hypothetical protein